MKMLGSTTKVLAPGQKMGAATLALVAAMSVACTTGSSVSVGGSGAVAAERSEEVLGGATRKVSLTPLQIRERMRAFADYYRDRVATVCDRVAGETSDPVRGVRARQLKIDAATAMYDIVVDPAPTTAMINALVMVSLQTSTAERHGPYWFGPEAGQQILAMAQEIQEEAFDLAAQVMSQEQRQQLLDLVEGWVQANPDEARIWYVRLDDLPGVRGQITVLSMVDTLTDLPAKFLGKFIPGVTDAGESASEATLLAERITWLAPRLMILAQWRAEILVHQSLGDPQVAQGLDVARRVTAVMEGLPDTLDAQRAGFVSDLEKHGQTVSQMLDHTDSIASHTAVLMEKLDTVLARIQTMIAAAAIANAGRSQSDVPGRPFDITEYTAAFAELDATVQNATRLLDDVEHATQDNRLAQKLGVVKADLSGLIWQAGGAATLAGLLIVLAAKLIPRRG